MDSHEELYLASTFYYGRDFGSSYYEFQDFPFEQKEVADLIYDFFLPIS